MQKKMPFLTFLSGKLVLDNAPAFCDDQSRRWFRYGELRDQIHTLTSLWHPSLSNNGSKRGLILCALPRTIKGVIAYLSAVNSGHAILLIDPDVAPIDLFIKTYQPDWVLIPSALYLGEDYTPTDWPDEDLYFWRRTTPSPLKPHPNLFLLLLPPGPPESTKAVRLSYENVSSCLSSTLEALPFTSKTRSLIHMPLSYSFSLSVLHMTLSAGGRAIFTERNIKDRSLWNTARDREVTLFAGVPFHYDYIIRAGLTNLHVPQLKTFLLAGGRLYKERTLELLRQTNEREGQLYILYGQTEASPRMAILPLHTYPEKSESSGRAIKGGKLWAEDERIFYQGPNVMMGYAQSRKDIVLDNSYGNILKTGDTGHIDKDGFLYLNPK